MFKSMKNGGQVYIFHKDGTPRLEMGTIMGDPIVRPSTKNPSGFLGVQDMVVDVVVSVGGADLNFKEIPAFLDISDSYSNGESMVMADNKEAMVNRLTDLKKNSQDLLASVDYHRRFVNACDNILADLSPEIAERRAQKAELDDLKSQMTDMKKNITLLMDTNRQLIDKLSEKEKLTQA